MTKRAKKNTDALSPRKVAYDFYFTEADRITQRIDWFLIFNAILLEAYFTLSQHENRVWSAHIIASFGAITNFMWAMNGLRAWMIMDQLGLLLGNKKLMGEGIVKQVEDIFSDRRTWSSYIRWARPTPSFSIIIPSLTLLTWLTIMIVELSWWLVLTNLVLAILVALITSFLGSGPITRNRQLKD